MEHITTVKMIQMLEVMKGATMAGFIAITDPYNGKPLQKNRETGKPNQFIDKDGCHLVKIQRGQAMFNCHYNKGVEKRVARRINLDRVLANLPELEGDALKRAIDARFRKGENWQQVVVREDGTLTPFAEHKGNGALYLRTMFYRPIGEVTYIDVRTGEKFTPEQIKDVLPVKSANTNQGLSEEEQVWYNIWKLNGIRALNVKKQTFRVRPPLEKEAEEVFKVLNAHLSRMDVPVPPEVDEVVKEG
jgi:hypothetical protein